MGLNKKQQQKIQRKKKKILFQTQNVSDVLCKDFFTQNQCRNWLICLYGLLEILDVNVSYSLLVS